MDHRGDAVSQSDHTAPAPRAGGDTPLDGRTAEFRQARLIMNQRIRFGHAGLGTDAVKLQHRSESTLKAPEDAAQLVVVGLIEGKEDRASGIIRVEDTVQRDDVEVDIQIEGVTEPLNETDAAALRVDDLTFGARSPAHRCKERTQEGAEDGSGETGVERHPVTQADRQRQHPLADGDPRQNPVHQVGRRIRHAASQARRAKTAAFARKRDQPVEAAPVAMHPDESVPEVAADQEGAELAFDEPRQRPVPISGLLEEPVQSLCDDAVQGGGLGVPR